MAREAARVGGEVKAPDPLYRDDLPLPEGRDGGADRVSRQRVFPRSRSTRAEDRSGHRNWSGNGSGGPRDPRTLPRTRGHCRKGRIVVFSRSNGVRSTIEYRGPHWVQVMKG